MNQKLGAHLSIAGGHHLAIQSIVDKGGSCLQIFSSSPRRWKDANISTDEISKFNQLKKEHSIDPVYFHACYLVNLADLSKTGDKSVNSLIFELNLAAKMNIKGSIVHAGSFKNKDFQERAYSEIRETQEYKVLLRNIHTVLKNTPKNTLLILENAGIRKIGQDLQNMGKLIRDIDNPRVRVCLDTCHLHAAGYDLSTEDKFENFLNIFDQWIGLKKLEVVHMNDSKDALGSLRDRHENIGKGNVGIEVFRNLLNHKQTKSIPFIIETPGFDNKGPDKKNLDILKGLF